MEKCGPEKHDCNSSCAAQNYGWDGSEPLRGDAGFELADFVGRTDEQPVDGADASAHLVRRSKLHQGVAYDDAHHIACANQDQRNNGQRQVAGQSENRS